MLFSLFSRLGAVAVAALSVSVSNSAATAQFAKLGKNEAVPAGVVGQRQSAANNSTILKPMTRLNNRLLTRVQSRLNDRIDKNYIPDKTKKP